MTALWKYEQRETVTRTKGSWKGSDEARKRRASSTSRRVGWLKVMALPLFGDPTSCPATSSTAPHFLSLSTYQTRRYRSLASPLTSTQYSSSISVFQLSHTILAELFTSSLTVADHIVSYFQQHRPSPLSTYCLMAQFDVPILLEWNHPGVSCYTHQSVIS